MMNNLFIINNKNYSKIYENPKRKKNSELKKKIGF